MSYIDGYVYAVPEARKKEFISFAQNCAKIFKKHGALRVIECWADEVPDGKVTSFPMAVKLEKGEAVLFSWCEWPDKDFRNKACEAIMADMEKDGLGEMPFDGKRMIFGGFIPVVDE